jgi:hypothetical protein
MLSEMAALEFAGYGWCVSVDGMRRIERNSESGVDVLVCVSASGKGRLRELAGDGAVQDGSNGRVMEGFAAFFISNFLNSGHWSRGADSSRRGFGARSFSIKKQANLPWNALDRSEIRGLCSIKLKLQLSPKLTHHR